VLHCIHIKVLVKFINKKNNNKLNVFSLFEVYNLYLTKGTNRI